MTQGFFGISERAPSFEIPWFLALDHVVRLVFWCNLYPKSRCQPKNGGGYTSHSLKEGQINSGPFFYPTAEVTEKNSVVFPVRASPHDPRNIQVQELHPRNLTWSLKRSSQKRKIIFMFRFHPLIFEGVFPNLPVDKIVQRQGLDPHLDWKLPHWPTFTQKFFRDLTAPETSPGTKKKEISSSFHHLLGAFAVSFGMSKNFQVNLRFRRGSTNHGNLKTEPPKQQAIFEISSALRF